MHDIDVEVKNELRTQADVNKKSLKGGFGIFEVGWYEVLFHSQCITYNKWLSARPQLEEAGSCTRTDTEQSTAVDAVSSKTYFSHLQKGPPKKMDNC